MINSSIPKENIPNLKFPNTEVLKKKLDQKKRYWELQRALVLGNLERQKVKIIFEDTMGIKTVETTIWGITDTQVILKQAILIPLQRIIDIR